MTAIPERSPDSLTIAAGAAFGSGAHPSTALMLEMLQGVALSGRNIRTVLDVGTGSGVLAIATALHFPDAHIIASDVEAESPAFVAHNAALNGVEEQITPLRARNTDHPAISASAPYDLLLCNISMEAIIPLLRDFHSLTGLKSLLMFSGLQLPMRDTMIEAVNNAGFSVITLLASGMWYSMLAMHESQAHPANTSLTG